MFNKQNFTNREAKFTAALNYELLLKMNKNCCLMLEWLTLYPHIIGRKCIVKINKDQV